MEPDREMREVYDSTAKEIVARWEGMDKQHRRQLLVGFAGPPGAGKTTMVQQLCRRIPGSICLPMDGYHYTKARLAAFDDPVEAFNRRGAHWTFDGSAFVRDLKNLRAAGSGSFPSFDHKVGDPVIDDIVVSEDHTIVLVEGNYLLLDVEPWSQARDILDYVYFVHCDLAVVAERVRLRHIAVGCSPEEAQRKVQTNDSLNAEQVLQSAHRANATLYSK